MSGNTPKIDWHQDILDELVGEGITLSLVYGQCGDNGVLWSFDVLTKTGQCFDKPYVIATLDEALFAVRRECVKRGWLQ